MMIHPLDSDAAALRAPEAKLVLYPTSGHGVLFQHIDAFVHDALRFLDAG